MGLFQVHLAGKGCSNRGVRFKTLSPDEVEKVNVDAAKLVGTEATIVELKKRVWAMGVRRMVQEYSDPALSEEGLQAKGIKWKKTSVQELDEKIATIFEAKDCAYLEALYRQYHEITEPELQALSGKVLAVSSD